MEILLIAPIEKYSLQDCGYGSASAGIAYVLERMKQENRINAVHCLNTARLDPQDIPDHMVDVALCMVHPNSFLHHTKGTEIVRTALGTARKRFLSVVWETTPLPARWKPFFESGLFDAFISPSYFVAHELEKTGSRPVYYCPHYIPTEDIPSISPLQKKEEEMFTVLYIGQHTKRKGLEDAVVAFVRALGEYADTRLILKYHSMTDREINPEQLIYHAVATNSLQPKSRIYTITTMLDRRKLYALYRVSSVLFFPSRGEGFGLPIAEAMATGIRVIYTGWSSMPELGTATGNSEIAYILDESVGMSHYGYDTGSQYAVPLMNSCISALRDNYQQWKTHKEDYYSNAQNNRAVIKERFGYASVSDCIEHFITGHDGFAPGYIDQRMRETLRTQTHKKEPEHMNIW